MKSRLAAGFALALAGGAVMIAIPQAAHAQPAEDPPPSFVDRFEAGQACEFPLTIEGTGADLHTKEFENAEGEVVRRLTWGEGYDFTYTNEETGESVFLPSGFGAGVEVFHEDGTMTAKLLGNFVLVLFPTDYPPGPSTTQHLGVAVLTIDQDGNTTVEHSAGKETDICALLR